MSWRASPDTSRRRPTRTSSWPGRPWPASPTIPKVHSCSRSAGASGRRSRRTYEAVSTSCASRWTIRTRTRRSSTRCSRTPRSSVQKSLAEGFGLTVVEAMWKSRPVVASAVGGIADQITDGQDGLLLDDPADLAGFGRAVHRILDDPSLANSPLAGGTTDRQRRLPPGPAPRTVGGPAPGAVRCGVAARGRRYRWGGPARVIVIVTTASSRDSSQG